MTRLVRLRAVVLRAGSALVAGRTQPRSRRRPPQQPTFRVAVDYVEVDALVTDRQGNFVRDLKKEDFQVLEDGKPQTIANFSLVDIPDRARRSAALRESADRARRADERAAVRRPRLRDGDRRSAHALRTQHAREAAAAKQFIERHLGANDLMARRAHRAGRPTRTRSSPATSGCCWPRSTECSGRKLRLGDARQDQRVLQTRGDSAAGRRPLNDPDDAERAFNARSTLDDAQQCRRLVRDRCAAAARRFCSSAKASTTTSTTDSSERLEPSRRVDDPRRHARRDRRGHAGERRDLRHRSARPAPTRRRERSTIRIVPRRHVARPRAELAAERSAAVAGQPAHAVRRDRRLRRRQPQRLRDGLRSDRRRQQLVLRARVLPADRQAGRQVPQDRRPGDAAGPHRPRAQRLRAAEGKADATEATANATAAMPPKLREALDSPLPVSGLTMHVFAAPFKGTAPNASVLFGVEMRGRDLQLGAERPSSSSSYHRDRRERRRSKAATPTRSR